MAEKKEFSLGDNQNLVIKASAGSGKTFQLAMRFISLLFCFPNEDPAQIVAITFTRKAAGEILDKIIGQLLEMIDDPALLRQRIEQNLLPAELTPAMLPELLGRILKSRELQISTIDSFLVRIIEAFSPEFGISGAVEMIDEATDTGMEQVLRDVIRREKGNLLPLLKEFAEGSNARNLTDTLRDFINENYPKYLLFPAEESWGNLQKVGAAKLTQGEIDRCADTLLVGRENYEYPGKIRERISTLIDLARSGKTKGFGAEHTPEKLFFYRKQYTFSEEMAAAAEKLARHVATIELDSKIGKSRAAYRMLKLYDDLYSEKIRSQGRIAFRDLPKLLGSLAEDCKLDLEYRLDTRNRHYMLDEFQDTSDSQWNFMANLVAEAIQGDQQSFFLVGDVKQALYLWRQGNPRLFDLICAEHNLKPEYSDTSYRSAPQVIDAVNQTFLSGERQSEPYRAMLERLDFHTHTAAKSKLSGYAKLFEVVNQAGKDDQSLRIFRVLELLEEIRPLERGLSAAILLRTNKEVEKYKQGLAALHFPMPISAEGAAKPAESMVCTILFLLLRLANHPGDGFAPALGMIRRRHGQLLTPQYLAAKLGLDAAENWVELSDRLHAELVALGLSGLVEKFRRAWAAELAAFDRERVEVVSRAARNFTGTVDEFLARWDKFTSADQSRSGTIQIMTIHKSKGLEFDIVILPELGVNPSSHTPTLAVEPMPPGVTDFTPSWVSFLPGDAAEAVLPGLQQIKATLEADQFYERGCGLYVAMTRAKRALYMIVGKLPDKENKGFRADKMLYDALQGRSALPGAAGIFESGDPLWYENEQAEKPSAAEDSALFRACPAREIHWESPSALPEQLSPWQGVSNFEPSLGAELGTRLHAMFEQVQFVDTLDPAAIEALAGNDEIGLAAREIWATAMAPGSEIYQALTRPTGNFRLHREWRFLLRTPAGQCISGCFDRVEIALDDSDRIVGATVSDYKSDDLTSEAGFLARHAEQLKAYRAALAQLLQLAPEKVACRLLALRLGKVIPVFG